MLFPRFIAAVKPGIQSAFLGKCKPHLHYSEVNLIKLEWLFVYSGRRSGGCLAGMERLGVRISLKCSGVKSN